MQEAKKIRAGMALISNLFQLLLSPSRIEINPKNSLEA
jgi:hypothetical protein